VRKGFTRSASSTGRGLGTSGAVWRQSSHAIRTLEKYIQASEQMGGWGAVIVTLKPGSI
jgi:hypothetical protein